jgi:uncharacterized membrane protein HdeD (DUF308 family)
MAKTAADAGVEMLGNLSIIRGVVAILFGIMALVWPGLTVLTFTTILVLWLLVSGVINLVHGFSSIKAGGWGWLLKLLVAAVQLGVGAYLIQRPALSVLTLVALLAIAFIVDGVVAVVAPFLDSDSPASNHKFVSVIYGVLAVLAGIIIWRYPVSGTLAFVWVVGLFALISGPMWIVFGVGAKKLEQ